MGECFVVILRPLQAMEVVASHSIEMLPFVMQDVVFGNCIKQLYRYVTNSYTRSAQPFIMSQG